jgi:hypothetical protein
MSTFGAHISRGARRRTVFLLLTAGALVVVLRLSAATGSACIKQPGYGWPVKPFDRAHPVRANFGDPRTTFNAPPTMPGLMTGSGIFDLHNGIDISAENGTPVYAVRSGTVSLLSGETVAVDSGDGFVAQYWHIAPAVQPGQQAIADQTVLGYVKGYEHVHFSEVDNGRPVNPLAPGHLCPYLDTTTPQVVAISFRSSTSGPELLPQFVHGKVIMIANAFDMPALPIPGSWGQLPVAPALITWRIERAKDGRLIVPERTAFDVRSTLPRTAFWELYARGTRQNMSKFAGYPRGWRVPGVYLYRLTPQPFDTTSIPTGIYDLVVTATDIRGNRSSSRQTFIVRNNIQP